MGGFLMNDNIFYLRMSPLDNEMVEMTRETKLGTQLVAVMHCDSFDGDICAALHYTMDGDPIKVKLVMGVEELVRDIVMEDLEAMYER